MEPTMRLILCDYLNAHEIIEKLKKINKLGVKIAIDDFGTGYSSLSYLKELPIDTLKIDKSFIMDLPHDLNNLKLVKTIIALGNNLELAIVAKGVETLEQKNMLLEYHCKYIQGYFYSRPLPASDMATLLHGF
jgi:EAL domain-containing protein (putative c-di-GMP-specific phosphodiesterase class I)